jgi:hypothetical protein
LCREPRVTEAYCPLAAIRCDSPRGVRGRAGLTDVARATIPVRLARVGT